MALKFLYVRQDGTILLASEQRVYLGPNDSHDASNSTQIVIADRTHSRVDKMHFGIFIQQYITEIQLCTCLYIQDRRTD